tara:strand:- start:784 stop:1038 length:255 start_codon:yes stop_codon:yes gene_type:complete
MKINYKNWSPLKHGGEIYEGADASDFPEDSPLGEEVGRYDKNGEHIVFHAEVENDFIYLTVRQPQEGGDTGLVIRLPANINWQQ